MIAEEDAVPASEDKHKTFGIASFVFDACSNMLKYYGFTTVMQNIVVDLRKVLP